MVTEKATKTDSRLAARCAAVASIGAAVIHFAVAPMHWSDWLPSGVFFAGIALFQLVWGFLAWSFPTRLLLAAGVIGNAASAALWALSRTAGAPMGPNAGEPEAVEAAGICVLLLQCYVVMGAAWALHRRSQPEVVSGFSRAFVLLGANTLMVGAVTIGLASSLQGHHQHHGDAAVAEVDQRQTHATNTEGHHHHADPLAPPDSGVIVPDPAEEPVESGRPVTDMGLTTDGDHHAADSLAPAEADGHQHSHGDGG